MSLEATPTMTPAGVEQWNLDHSGSGVLAVINESGPIHPDEIGAHLAMSPADVYAILLSFVRSDEPIAVVERSDGLWQSEQAWNDAHPEQAPRAYSEPRHEVQPASGTP